MNRFLVLLFAFPLLCYSFASSAMADEYTDEGHKQDAGESHSEGYPEATLPPTFPCTKKDQPCPCVETQCPFGYKCNEAQQCVPKPCKAGECPQHFQCSDGICVGLTTPCWGALCRKGEACVVSNNAAECRKLCGEEFCGDHQVCVRDRCIGKDQICEQEGQTRECRISCDDSSYTKGKQLCSGGSWQTCQIITPCTHTDCQCSATIYCKSGKIYQTYGGFRQGYQGRCLPCEDEGDVVASCQNPCPKEIEGKRFPTSEKTPQSLCRSDGCACNATPHPMSLISVLLLLLFLKKRGR